MAAPLPSCGSGMNSAHASLWLVGAPGTWPEGASKSSVAGSASPWHTARPGLCCSSQKLQRRQGGTFRNAVCACVGPVCAILTPDMTHPQAAPRRPLTYLLLDLVIIARLFQLSHSIPFHSPPFHSILSHSILLHSIPFPSHLFQSHPTPSPSASDTQIDEVRPNSVHSEAVLGSLGLWMGQSRGSP